MIPEHLYLTPGLPGLDAFVREILSDQIAEAVFNAQMAKLEAELAASRQTMKHKCAHAGSHELMPRPASL